MALFETSLSTPLGVLDVFATETGVCAIEPRDRRERVLAHLARHFQAGISERGDPYRTVWMLERYFAGALDALDRLPLDLQGTDFQLEVWRGLRTIAIGTTKSYGGLAQQLGRAQSSRAVGMANSKNPLMIVVPCHRVIGASGALTGYAGGLWRKEWLLRHEGVGHEGVRHDDTRRDGARSPFGRSSAQRSIA